MCSLFLFGAYYLLANFGHAQTPTLPLGIPLTTATVDVTVKYDPKEDIFAYSYSVSNSSQSVGEIDSFDLDISTIVGGSSLSSNGLLNSATGYHSLGTTKLAAQVEDATVPVGFHSQPLGWHSGSTAQFTASWYGPLPPGGDIPPGQSLGTFVLTSHGPPGIRRVLVEPAYDPDDFMPSIDESSDEELQKTAVLIKAIPLAIRSLGFTVGPVQPPNLTDVGQLLDFVASLKHQAAALGWISGPGADGVVQSLDAKLSAAKASISSGDKKTAINQLNAFINELQAQHGKAISDNAFYLLQPNALFVISKLGS